MKGKKKCPLCGAEAGPRLKVCGGWQCGHVFAVKRKGPSRRKRTPLTEVENPHENLTENPPPTVGVSSRDALDTFIEQLQAARDASDRTGGCYSAFLHHKTGILQVDVWSGMVLR